MAGTRPSRRDERVPNRAAAVPGCGGLCSAWAFPGYAGLWLARTITGLRPVAGGTPAHPERRSSHGLFHGKPPWPALGRPRRYVDWLRFTLGTGTTARQSTRQEWRSCPRCAATGNGTVAAGRPMPRRARGVTRDRALAAGVEPDAGSSPAAFAGGTARSNRVSRNAPSIKLPPECLPRIPEITVR